MITIGGILAVVFVVYEWKWAPVPIMPCKRPVSSSVEDTYANVDFSTSLPSSSLSSHVWPVGTGWPCLLRKLFLQ